MGRRDELLIAARIAATNIRFPCYSSMTLVRLSWDSVGDMQFGSQRAREILRDNRRAPVPDDVGWYMLDSDARGASLRSFRAQTTLGGGSLSEMSGEFYGIPFRIRFCFPAWKLKAKWTHKYVDDAKDASDTRRTRVSGARSNEKSTGSRNLSPTSGRILQRGSDRR